LLEIQKKFIRNIVNASPVSFQKRQQHLCKKIGPTLIQVYLSFWFIWASKRGRSLSPQSAAFIAQPIRFPLSFFHTQAVGSLEQKSTLL
jgi:hypothetical protein